MISPIFNQLSEKYPDVVFLKVDVDEMQGTARQCGISAMPTFQFFHRTKKIDEFKGADPNKLQQTIDRHARTYSQSSSPGGQVLGSGQALGGQPLGGRPLGGAASGEGSPSGGRVTDQPPAPSASQETTPARAGQAFSPDPHMLQSLKEMGFPENRAIKALETVKNSSVQAAMEWIFEHMEDPDIDTPSATVPASAPASDTEPNPKTVHNAMCDMCQQQIIGIRYKCKNRPDYDLCETCKSKGQHDPSLEFETHAEDIVNPTLTLEERALQIEKLNKRISEVRAKKMQDEEERDKDREIARRHGGKEAAEAKKKWEEANAKREEDKMRREKEEEKRARERIKQKIEQDKLERAAKNKKDPVAVQPLQPAQPVVPATPKVYTEAQLQIRLTDGSMLKATFSPSTTMREVFSHIEANRTDGRGAFSLMTTFPRRTFTKSDFQVTLQEAGLVPNGTIVVTKV